MILPLDCGYFLASAINNGPVPDARVGGKGVRLFLAPRGALCMHVQCRNLQTTRPYTLHGWFIDEAVQKGYRNCLAKGDRVRPDSEDPLCYLRLFRSIDV